MNLTWSRWPTAAMALCLLTISAVPVPATTIVVNSGTYESVQRAGAAEATVNWNDADLTDDTICTECFAAAELQQYLRRITGRAEDFTTVDDEAVPPGDLILVGGPRSNAATARLAAALQISQTDLDGLGPEGYVIKSARADDRQVLLIAGGGRVGTLYGVYDLLHRLGVRWYAPGEINEEVPRQELDSLPEFNVSESPKFFTRGFHAWEDRGDEDFLLWMARNRLNYWCVQQSNKPLLHKLGIMLAGGGHVLTSYYLNPRSRYPYDHPRFTGDEDQPPDPYPVSPQYQGDANKDGKLTYFEAHPEWYGLRGGRRSDNIRGGGGDNFCTSNLDAMTEWMKGAISDLAEGRYRDADIINAWTLDGGKWCECERCQALGSPTDRNLLFVHRYAQEIKRAQAEGRIHRPIRLLFLAYADVLQPPTRPLPEDFDYDTCIATYFPIVRCYVHKFDDPKCSRNARYNERLHGWAVDPERFYRGQICIGEYYNVSGYKCLPICFMSTMAADIPYYYSLGARHFHYMHCTTGNWGNKALTNWQMARQLWNPSVDCADLWRDYFRGRYGAAAAQMRLFYESLEQMLCNVSELKYGLARRLERGSTELFPSAHLRYEKSASEPSEGPTLVEILQAAARCRELIDRVGDMELPPRIAHRVAEDERLFTYGERTVKFYDALCRTYLRLREGRRAEAIQAFKEARVLAELLRRDTTSTKLASSHANARDALSASYASGALAQLAVMLGPLEPDKVSAFDPAQQPLVLTGKQFQGGGALRYGYGLNAFPGRIHLSDVGNYMYGRGTAPLDRITAWFRLSAKPKTDLYLVIVGLKTPQPPGGDVRGRVRINDQVVFEDNVPLAEKELTRFEVVVPAKVLRQGLNTIQISNIEPHGRAGSRPWFGLDRIELRDHSSEVGGAE